MAKMELQCVGERRLLIGGVDILALLTAAGVDVVSEGMDGQLRVRLRVADSELREYGDGTYEIDVPVAEIATEDEGMYVEYDLPTEKLKLQVRSGS